MAVDSSAGAILARNRSLSIVAGLGERGWRVINLDAIDSGLLAENLGLKLSPDASAQIRYTSGSTGKPKGVLRSHRRNLHSNLLTINATRICPADRLLVLRHVGVATKDVFNGLLVGAAVFPFDIRKDGLSKLPDFIVDHGITCYASTPSIFRYFISEVSDGRQFSSVRMVQLGGEPLFSREVESYKTHFTESCVLMNQLSSNESGTLCQYLIGKETVINGPIVPVGYPVEGKEILLLDEDGKEVGLNQVGEIAVQSRYLSDGYWGDRQVNDTRFVPDPNGGEERVFLTGDLAQMLSDGMVVYFGRKDDQVKIRGCKVHISEVHALLLEHPQVKQAAVVAWDRESGEKYLAAYVVPSGNSFPPIDELQSFLRQKLPDYMTPAAFVFLDALPLINGKLDRRALPEPQNKRPEMKQSYVSPRSEDEVKLVKIWEALLEVRPIGVHDNFFDLGGHSLAATRVVSQVIKQFQLEIPLQSLFQAPTIAEMANVITEHQGKKLGERELDHILAELETLSEEEAQRLLAVQSGAEKAKDRNE